MIIRHANTSHAAPGKSSRFTGQAVGDAVLPTTDGVTINSVTFAPGARTHWHTHEHGQLLFVVTGYGAICTSGEVPRPLCAGDTVWIPPGERHWHGAASTSFMTHTAVSFGATKWAHEVSDDEYSATPTSQDHEEGAA